MRLLMIACLAAVGLGCPPGAVTAQVKITDVAIGFPSPEGEDGPATYYKAGTWVPIRVQVRAGAQGFPGGRLWVETWDSDDIRNRYPAQVGRLSANQTTTIASFARPGSLGADIRVSIAAEGQEPGANFSANRSAEALDIATLVCLKLGGPTTDLQKAIRALEPDPKQLRIRYTVHVNRGDQLPACLFGYAGVDLAILTTADPTVLNGLLAGPADRREALAAWIRQGGRLVVSVAPAQSQRVAKLLEQWQSPLARVLTPKAISLNHLQGLVHFAETHGKPFDTQGAPVTELRIPPKGAGVVEVLAQERDREQPLMVRSPYGLGNITLLAIDLDKPPFTTWDGRVEFWQKLLTRLAPRVVVPGTGTSTNASAAEENDITTKLQRQLEVFPEVRPVSFGVVALLIFVYILVVGPLDYFVLKKVVKRFHGTWVTFPTMVILVTGAALLMAGSYQSAPTQINKVDLVDIDQLALHPTIQATSWFTVYRHDMGRLTVGIEPGQAWSATKLDQDRGDLVVSWLGRPEEGGLNSTGRRHSENLYRAWYDYQPHAAGLDRVPIAHASTKSFTSSWAAPCRELIATDLHYDPANSNRLTGSVTSHLPVELEGAILYYAGRWYSFDGRLRPGKQVPVSLVTPREFDDWMARRQTPPAGASFDATTIIKTLMFHEKQTLGSNRRNNMLRTLDQSWRLRELNGANEVTHEAILFGRFAREVGRLEDVGSGASSASRLLLNAGMGAGSDRPTAATLTQDTYLRVYVPVTPGREASND